MIRFTAQDEAITFTVRAQPRATKTILSGAIEGALIVKIAAPPVEGAANEELIRFLAKVFAVPRRAVTILSGATAKNKIVRLHGLTATAFELRLAHGLKDEK